MQNEGRTNEIKLRESVSSTSEARRVLAGAGEVVLVTRGKPRNLAMKCPCGCNEVIIVNVDPRAGPAWRVYLRKGKLSVYPSIWKESGCKSHFIISENNIWWCDRFEEDYSFSAYDAQLQEAILNQLGYEDLVAFEELAKTIDEVPWIILVVCRDLVKKNLLKEGLAERRGSFVRVAP